MSNTAATLQFLHTTDAYQLAVLRLMVAEANFAAERLGLNESVSIEDAMRSDDRSVEPPVHGIGGCVCSPNYSFVFFQGKLRSISKLRRFSSPLVDVMELAQEPCAIDTNGACALAKQWFTALSVDVDAFEKNGPPNVFQAPARRRDAYGHPLRGIENNIKLPLFTVSWGSRFPDRLARMGRVARPGRPIMPSSQDALFVEILGTTQEPLNLRINEPSLLRRPSLQLPNAAELLGQTPPPRHFVEQVLGGVDAYETVAAPERLEAWLLTSADDNPRRENVDRAGPVRVAPETAAVFSKSTG